MHQKYGMIRMVQNFYSAETEKCAYLAILNNGRLNQQNNETNDPQCTNNNKMMTITIIIKRISMHGSINM